MRARLADEVRALSAYLEGEVTASERDAIEAQLSGSAEARRTLAQLQGLRDLLAAPAPALETIDLAARVRARVRVLGPSEPRQRRWPKRVLAGILASAAAVAAIVSLPRAEDAEFHAKANAGRQLENARWAGVHVFRVAENRAPERLGARINAGDGLVFTYTNLGGHPFRYVMIFALDAANEVRWFYPSYEAVGENPESVPIEGGRANAPLGELVQQEFAEGSLTFYALFTNEAAHVLQIEQWLKQQGRPRDEAPLAGAFLQRFDTTVAR